MRLRPCLVVLGTAFLVQGAACENSGRSESASPPAERTDPESQETIVQGPADPTAETIEVEQTKLIFMPDQAGGKFHNLLVLIRNTSDQVAIDVSGQVSIKEGGRLVHSLNPIPVNILPGSRGCFRN